MPQVALDVPEDGRGQVDQADGEQHEAEGVEVEPGAGDDVLRLDDVGDGAVALGARRGCGLLGGEPGRQLAADHAGEDQVGGVAEDLGADDVERHADHAERDDDGDAEPVRPEQPGEPFGRRPEVRRLLGGHAGAHPGRAVAAPGVGHAAGGLAGLGVLLGLAAGGARGRGGGGHAAASADSCDSTISTNVGQVCSNSSWVPLPTITPSSRTRIWSASAIVDTRWAPMPDAGRRTRAVRCAGRHARAARGGAQPGVGGEVEGGEGVVEQVDLGSADQGARDGEALPLTTGDVGAALRDRRLQLLGHGADEILGLRDPQGLPQLVVARVGVAVAQVARDGAGEQVGPLRDDPDAPPEVLGLHLADVDAVDADDATGRVEQPGDHGDECGLAGAGAADDGGGAARERGEGDVAQDG